MTNTTVPFKETNNFATFLVLTFLISLPAYIVATSLPQEMAALAGILITPAPITAALILSYRNGGLDAAKKLVKRAFDFKRIGKKIWYAPTLLLLPFLFFIASGIITLLQEPTPDPIFPIVAVPVTFLMFFLLAVFEEVGWMGYAYDPMQERWSALTASLALGTIWAIWHIPIYFLSGQSPQWIIVQLLSLIAIRTLIAWIYNNTGKSVFAIILFHAVYNVCTSVFVSFYIPLGHMITSLLIAITAIIVASLWDQATLTKYKLESK